MRSNLLKMSLLTCIAALAAATPCFAELGGTPASIQVDQLHMKGSLRISKQPHYEVHEIQTPGGTTVREYVTATGVVFAVAWRGRAMPDLRQLLGPYFTQYVETAKVQRSSHGRLAVENPGLVVRSGGHMRAFSGHAYVPQLMPPNVTAAEIQ